MTKALKEDLIEVNSRELTLTPEKYLEILLMALEIGAKDILSLEKSIENEDYILMHIMAHKLKGMFGNLRVNNVCDLAEQIDELAKSQAQIKQIKMLYIELEKVFRETNELFL